MASYEGTAVPLICGRVTHIVDPGDFWLRMGPEPDLVYFDEFERKLNPALRQLPVGKTDGVVEGSTVLVCCSKQDGGNTTQWRRATVIRIDWKKNMFDVLYMDYGYSEIVPATSICQTVPEDIAQHPVSCFRCALAGIQPIAKSWTNRGVKMFEKLALKKTLKVALVSYNHLTMSHRVALYDSTDSERSITHQMLEAETGLQTEEKVEEFAMDVVPVSYEDLYGCNPYDQLPSEECAQPNPESSTSELTANGEADQQQTNSTSCDTSSTDAEWDVVSDDTEDGQRTQLHGADTGNGQSRTAHGGLSVDCEARGRETASQFDTRDTDSEDRSPADEIVVPGFNLTVFQTRRMLSAEELQREREEAVRAERKAKLQKDMVECHRDLELSNPMTGQGQGQKWGNSDLLIGRQISEEHETEVFNQVVPVSSPAPLNDHAGAFEEDKKETNFDNHNVNNADEVEETAEILPEITSLDDNAECDEQDHRKSPITAGPSDGVECVMHSPQPDRSVKERGPLPPRTQPNLSAEEEEYHKQKQYKEILHEGVYEDGSHVVCAQFHSLVPLNSDPNEDEVKVLMQVVLEEAVKQAEVTDLALEVIASYSGVLRGTDLLCLLKSTCEKFVQLPVAKMPKHHTDFALLLTKLFYLSFDWPPLLKTVVEDFIMQRLEKWIIFNKKGSQTGLIQRHVEEVYLDCAEVVLLHCASILQASDSERFQFVFDEMREKVLETNVEYHARSRLLDLLVRYGNPYLEASSFRDAEEAEAPQVKKATKDQAVQSDTTPSPSSPLKSKSSDSSCAHRSTLTVESSSQTDTVAMAGGDVQAQMNVAVQTDWVGELLFASRQNSSGSMDGSERVDTVVAAPGRARRRRAVVEVLTKKESTGSSSRPDTKVLLSAAASVLCRQSSLASEPSDGEREGGLETAQSPRDVGYSVLSGSSEESLIPSNQVPGFTVMEDKSKASEQYACTIQSNENNSNNSSQPAVPKMSTGACESHEQEKSRNEAPECFQHPSPSSSFFSAVSSMSMSAWQSVFGSEVDADSYLKLKADEMESLNTSSTMSLDGNDSSVCSKESKAKRREGAAAKTGGTMEEDEEQKRVEEEGGGVVAEEKDKAESCKGREEEKKWSSFTPVHTGLKGTPYQGGERGSMVEDFPHLTHQIITSTQRTPTPPPLTQLSLQTIAAGLLRPEPEPASEERATSQELRNGQSQKDRRSEGDYKSSAHRNKIEEMGVCDVELNYTGEDESGSIPSDWEDRASPSIDRSEQKEYRDCDEASRLGGTDSISHGPFHPWLGGGDGSGDGQLTSAQLPVLNNAGDSTFLLQSSYMSEAHIVKEDSHQYGASSDEMGDLEKTPERYFSPLGGRPLSPVLDPGSGGDRQDNASRVRRRSVTSESDDAAVLTGDAVPYERGDLGFMARTGKKKKKTVFRPFEQPPLAAAAKPGPAREMWVPTSFFCTNCNSEGHIRSECTQPLRNGLMN